jgi:hypothetical protein
MKQEVDLDRPASRPDLTRKWIRNVGVSLALFSAASVTMSAMSAPASASTTYKGCTVNPEVPVVWNPDPSGFMQMDAHISVNCTEGRLVQVSQEIWEKDTPQKGQQRLIARGLFSKDFRPAGHGSIGFDGIYRVPNNHPGLANETLYQKVTFRVCDENICSPFTPREASAARTFNN